MNMLPIEIFYCYSSEDEGLKDELLKHLSTLRRQEIIKDWNFRKISGGREWEGQIDKHLNSARIILLLVSPGFVHSDYCYDVEMKRAMKRHEAGEARVIPIILRPVDWKGTPFEKLQAFPKDAKPVTRWENRDEAFLDVSKGIRQVCEEIQKGAGADNETSSTGRLHLSDRNKSLEVPQEDSQGSKILQKKQVVTSDVYCSRCGASPGEKTMCTGSYTEHDFKKYSGYVYCSRCGVSPSEKTVCTGSYIEHDFKTFSGYVYCSRCGVNPGKRTTCTGSYTEHDFQTYMESPKSTPSSSSAVLFTYSARGPVNTPPFKASRSPWKLQYKTDWSGHFVVQLRGARIDLVVNHRVSSGQIYETYVHGHIGSSLYFSVQEAPADGLWTLSVMETET